MSTKQIDELLDGLKVKLTEHSAKYVGATMGAGDDWRRIFDRYRDDIERLEFALQRSKPKPI